MLWFPLQPQFFYQVKFFFSTHISKILDLSNTRATQPIKCKQSNKRRMSPSLIRCYCTVFFNYVLMYDHQFIYIDVCVIAGVVSVLWIRTDLRYSNLWILHYSDSLLGCIRIIQIKCQICFELLNIENFDVR